MAPASANRLKLSAKFLLSLIEQFFLKANSFILFFRLLGNSGLKKWEFAGTVSSLFVL